MPLLVPGFDMPMRCGSVIHGIASLDDVLDSDIYGFALQQASLPFRSPEEVAGIAERFLRQFPAEAYPHLADLTIQHILRLGYHYAHEFAFGLDLNLDGLERVRDTA